MKFRYLHESPLSGGGKQCSNIMWDMVGKWPMKAGEFPKEHPVHAYAGQLEEFKSRGYWLSPFPEGDGFTMDLKNNQSADQVVRDIEECLGWERA